MLHVIVVSKNVLAGKAGDTPPDTRVAYGPCPSGYQEILEKKGWTHIGRGIFSKVIGGIEHRAINQIVPEILPMDQLPQ